VLVYSDNAQMTWERGKNKEVRYEAHARELDRCSCHVLMASVRYQSTHARPSKIDLCYTLLIWYRLSRTKLEMLVKIFVLMICALRTLHQLRHSCFCTWITSLRSRRKRGRGRGPRTREKNGVLGGPRSRLPRRLWIPNSLDQQRRVLLCLLCNI